MVITEKKKKRRGKKSDGWSWFERVNVGDLEATNSVFNNSVNFSAMSPDGGSSIGTGTQGGMSMGEAIENLMREDMNAPEEELLSIYFDADLKAIEIAKKHLIELNKEYFAIKKSGGVPDNALVGYKRKAERDEDIARKLLRAKLPEDVDLDSLLKHHRKVEPRTLTTNEISYIEEYLLNRKKETSEKKPIVGARFKHASCPIVFLVDNYDENLVYYKSEQGSYRDSFPIDTWNKMIENGDVRYLSIYKEIK